MEKHEHPFAWIIIGALVGLAVTLTILAVTDNESQETHLDTIETRIAEPSPAPTPSLLELIATEVAK